MKTLRESGTLTQKGGGRFKIGVITPGTGSSGTYPRETVEAAGRDKVFAAGTHMYLDHATESQDFQRPEGSVRDLVGVLTEDAHWDDVSGGLIAEARIYSHWKPVLEEMKDDIGISIRASGEVQESNGQRVVTKLTEARSIDFVTKAGRGGRILEILESARVQEGVNDETRGLLHKAVRAAHPDHWSWVRDHDGEHVWFDLEAQDYDVTYQQTYSRNGVSVQLTGTAIEVVPTTEYVPTQTSQPPAGGENEEDDMSTVTIEASEHENLKQKASRLTEADTEGEKLRKENAELKAEVAELKKAKAKESRREHVAGIVESHFANVDDPAGVAELLTESFSNTEETDEKISEAAKERAAKLSTNPVHGVGSSTPLNESSSSSANGLPTWDELKAQKGIR